MSPIGDCNLDMHLVLVTTADQRLRSMDPSGRAQTYQDLDLDHDHQQALVLCLDALKSLIMKANVLRDALGQI